MNSTKDDKKTQVQSKRDKNQTSVIEDFLKRFRNDGISAIAHLDNDEQAQVVNWAQDIVNKYGTILIETPMKIKNLVDLPCPKEDLKMAIKVLLPAYIGKGSNDIVALLKDRYVRLSAFQEVKLLDPLSKKRKIFVVFEESSVTYSVDKTKRISTFSLFFH